MNPLINKFISLLFIVLIHKYYVSSTLIDYNSDSNTHQMSLKIFHDDLEKELGFQENELDYKDYENTNLILENYLKKFIKIYSDEVQLELDYLGYERKNDLLIYYIEIYNNIKIKSLIIENKILFNSFKNQKNIILYRNNNFKKSFIHTNDNFQSVISIP
tara:strand:+ start:1666 stop:2145 length:480 start_codon:yes stop_codon:yes gene_type:complete